MHFTIAVIVCLGYFLSPVWSNGLNKDQIKAMIGLYADLKLSDNKNAEQNIKRVITESFGIEKPTKVFEDDSSTIYNKLHNLLLALADNDKSSDRMKVKKLTHFEVYHYLHDIVVHPEFENQLGYLTFQQLSEVFTSLKLYDSTNAKLEEHKSKIGDDNAINAAELLLIVLDITPEAGGLTLKQIEKFIGLYEVHETVSVNIDPSACQKVFEDLDITSKKDHLNLLFKSNRPFANVLMDLMIIASECSQMLEKNESRYLGPGEVVLFINEFNKLDKNQDGLLSDGESDPFVDQLKMVLNELEEPVNDTLTFDKAQDFINKFDGSDGIEVKKAVNIAEYLEIAVFYMTNVE